MVWVILIVEDSTVTVKCRTAIKVLLLYINLCLCVMLDSLSYWIHPYHFLLSQWLGSMNTDTIYNIYVQTTGDA